MNELEDLIPKGKHDISSISILQIIEPEKVESILPKLLVWIQDINWPVAQKLMDVLPRFHKQLVPAIKDVFKTDDDIWKCWTVRLMRKFPKDTVLQLLPEIRKFAENPTSGEQLEEVDEEASSLLQLFNL